MMLRAAGAALILIWLVVLWGVYSPIVLRPPRLVFDPTACKVTAAGELKGGLSFVSCDPGMTCTVNWYDSREFYCAGTGDSKVVPAKFERNSLIP